MPKTSIQQPAKLALMVELTAQREKLQEGFTNRTITPQSFRQKYNLPESFAREVLSALKIVVPRPDGLVSSNGSALSMKTLEARQTIIIKALSRVADKVGVDVTELAALLP